MTDIGVLGVVAIFIFQSVIPVLLKLNDNVPSLTF
jgi:hypothetical protein